MNELISKNDEMLTVVSEYQNRLFGYLDALQLPKQNVLVGVEERETVFANVPRVIQKIDEEKRGHSFYISKFIAACGAGLFDAALNYLWDETILSLRMKIAQFSLDYFKSAVPEEVAKKIRNEDDLRNVDDNDIVKGCQKIGLISDAGYRHLDFIRGMRNWVSAAHPNQEELSGLNLCSWLETCIKEVIGKDPVAPAITNQQLLLNIKTKVFEERDIEPIRSTLNDTPIDYIESLAGALFGMFCEPEGKVEVKNNIRLIAKDVWRLLSEQKKKSLGLRHATWAVNGDIERKNAAHDFLEMVNGLSYLSDDMKTAEFSDALNHLYYAHCGFNNFYNEPAFASLVNKYVPETGAIPDVMRNDYVRVLSLCLIGNGHGISNAAEPYYGKMVSKFTDKEIDVFLRLFSDLEFSSRLQYEDCQNRYVKLKDKIKTKTSKASFIRVFDFIDKVFPKALQHVGEREEYKRLINLIG